MAMPAMPGAGLVVIEAEFILGGLKTILDGPAMAFHRHQLLHGRALGAPCREEGQAAVGNVAAYAKATGHRANFISLALQLHFSHEVSVARLSLVSASPE